MAFLKLFLTFFVFFALRPALAFSQNDPELETETEAIAETEAAEEKEPEALYQSFVDSMKKIRLLQNYDEFFSAQHAAEQGRQLVNNASGKFQRRFYDRNLRLQKVEYWKQGASASQSEMEKLVEYNPPNASGVYSIFEKNSAEMFEKRTFYYSDGRLKSERVNHFDQDGNLLSFDVATVAYDSDLRAVNERLQKYNSNEKGIRLFSDEIQSSKYKGKVLEESAYYKNNVLRVKTVYQDYDKGDYVKTMYFDGGIIVRDFYRNNVKIDTSIKGGGVQ